MAKKMISEGKLPTIPYGKAVRVGNYKLWRGKYVLSGKEKASIDCIYVSSLDGTWMTRIPATSGMFTTICNGYATTEDDNLRAEFLGMIFCDMYDICNRSSEALHDAFHFLLEMTQFPYLLLSEKEMSRRMKSTMQAAGIGKEQQKEHIAKMVEYRRGLYELIERKKDAFLETYERQLAEAREKESESLDALRHDEIAEQAVDILNETE